jgi:hypothetical protein
MPGDGAKVMMDRSGASPNAEDRPQGPRKDDVKSKEIAEPGHRDDDRDGEEYEGLGVS